MQKRTKFYLIGTVVLVVFLIVLLGWLTWVNKKTSEKENETPLSSLESVIDKLTAPAANESAAPAEVIKNLSAPSAGASPGKTTTAPPDVLKNLTVPQ